ncbi:hypothetical protein [Mycobacterium sp. GA-2829]|uniref:hypothetical protein n=1 Tax=Mycobacterium sp. GA-2829 TaxID=1772283 RepID=UPI00074023E1|nr:hypothetical protein [Mycobacterium sp. GA-2829]KUI38274.1 hypothetical protein AU194_27095 [Mycobacterium sp. GA-2829]
MTVWYGGDMHWWGYVAMAIGLALFWALLVGGIVLAVQSFLGAGKLPQVPATPEQILATGTVRGELTEAEYRERLAALRTRSADG